MDKPERNLHNIAVIDSSIDDYQILVEAAEAQQMEVILISGEQGLDELAEQLEHRSEVDSLQIFSHGSQGTVYLGEDVLDSNTLSDHSATLEIIKGSLSEAGDILLYGCNVAQGDNGHQFIEDLSFITQADIAASSNRTGSSGDWILERSTGDIETLHDSFSALENTFGHSLATITVTNGNDAGAGSLRQALQDAVAGDTITFNSSVTNISILDTLVIAKNNITIDGDLNNDGTPDVTIDAGFNSSVMQVGAFWGAISATIDGVIIKGGLISGNGGKGANSNGDTSTSSLNGSSAFGAGINVGYYGFYANTLTLLNSSIIQNCSGQLIPDTVLSFSSAA